MVSGVNKQFQAKKMASGDKKIDETLGISKIFSIKDLEVLTPEKQPFRMDFGNYNLRPGEVYIGSPPKGAKRKGDSQIYSLKVSQELHNGTSKNFSMSRYVMCYKCNGNGSKSGASMVCSGCQGRRWKGKPIPYFQRKPIPYPHSLYLSEAVQERMVTCDECNGEGKLSMELCLLCKGKKVVTENKVFHVRVEKGMQIGGSIIFPREADQAPDTVPGDIVFVLQLKH